MKNFKKTLIFVSILVIITSLLTCCSLKTACIHLNITSRSPINVGVLFSNSNDLFLSIVRKNLEDIQKQNEGKVKFTFFDGENNLAVQNEIINNLLQDNYDLLLINFVDKKNGIIDNIINKIKQRNIPLILFNTTLPNTNAIKSYKKSIIINTDFKQSGILQGQILVNAWNTDKEAIDKNGDNILQYVMLQGRPDSIATILRTKYSIETINNAGIQTQELASISADWNKELAKDAVNSLFLQYDNKIEAIISNNDAMAIGAIEALQQYGYNMGDRAKTIAVVGIDAISEAQDLIKEEFMTGSVLQDPHTLAEALYTVGTNLAAGKAPTEGTNYTLDPTETTILLPYQEYIAKSAFQIHQ